MEGTGDVFIGAIFVLISAAGRFNTPPSNRCSTTALRYYMASFCYLLVGMGLYFGLLSFRPLLEQLKREAGIFGGLANDFSPAPLVALLLTVLLPKIPLLADGDAWIRERLQRLGSIPHEARRLAAELQRARFSVSARLQEQVATNLISEGFESDDLLFEAAPGLRHVWTKASVLMTQVEEWENDRRFASFIAQYESELKRIKERYRWLRPKVRNCFRWLREITPVAGSRSDDLVFQVQIDLTEQSTEILHDLLGFISRGLLQCGVTSNSRATSLAMLGFDLRSIPFNPPLTLNHMMAFFGIVGVTVLAPVVFAGAPPGVRIEELMARIVMISALYSAAVVCAVYPKERWAFARKDPRIRPIAFYFVAGGLAAVVSLAVSFLFNLAIFRSLSWAWGHLMLTYPWSLCSFSTAFIVAWMTDDEPTSPLIRNRLRWVEGLAGAGVLVSTAVLVIYWLGQLPVRPETALAHRSPPAMILAMSSAIGFTIGYLIPTWYREAPREEEAAQPSELAGAPEAASVNA
jgi:hypothetical protein